MGYSPTRSFRTLAACAVCSLGLWCGKAPAQITRLMSQGPDGGAANGVSGAPAISAYGYYIAFASDSSNLVPDDTNNFFDIFLVNRLWGFYFCERVSVGLGGVDSNGPSYGPAISADGRYVAFESSASNLVLGDTNASSDIFVRDRETNVTTRVSVATGGAQANSHSGATAISADGRYVAFSSNATNLVPGDTNPYTDVFVHDRQTGTTTRVSVATGGAQTNDDSYEPALSADGRYVAFVSVATNLVPGDTGGTWDVFVHDRQTGTTTRVSVATGGAQANLDSDWPAISADGRYVAFTSYASNLVPSDTNGAGDVFVHDRQTSTTARVSVGSGGVQGDGNSTLPSISGDGRYVAFGSISTNFFPGDIGGYDVFVHDRQTGTTIIASVATGGAQVDDDSGLPSITTDGRTVVFPSWATNFGFPDTNNNTDVFLRSLTPDGEFDLSGAPVSFQDTQTSLGNNTLGDVTFTNGSELDGAWVERVGPYLMLTIAGNVDFLQHHLEVFIDCAGGGQNRLLQGNPNVGASNPLGRMGDNGTGNGLRFDTGFEADYFLGIGDHASSPSVVYATLPTAGGGIGRNLGTTTATGLGFLTGDNPDGIMCSFNNTNTSGVSAGTGASSATGILTGVEFAIPLSAIGNPQCGIKICAFLTSNSHGTVSNQVLDGLGGSAALGEARNVNFAARTGRQSFDAIVTYGGSELFTLPTPQTDANFGRSVALRGNDVLVGARRLDRPGANDSGGVFASFFNDYTWSSPSQVTLSTLPSAGDRLGHAIAIDDGGWAFVGAPERDTGGANAGAVWVLQQTGPGTWTQHSVLTAPDAQAGAQFGYSVDLRNEIAIVGAPFFDGAGADSGKVYIYTLTGGVWTLAAARTPSDAAAGDQFGLSVSLNADGDTAVVGAPGDDRAGLTDAGSAYLYTREGLPDWPSDFTRRWEASDAVNAQNFGTTVTLEGDFAAIGAPNTGTGAVYPFFRTGVSWPTGHGTKVTPGDGVAGDTFGLSLASTGTQLAVGAPNHGEPFFDSGALYTFTLGDTTFSASGKFIAPDSVTGDALGGNIAIDGTRLIGGAGAVDGGGAAYLFDATPTTPVVLSSPSSTTPALGSMVNLQWTLFTPQAATYQVRRNGTPVASGPVASGQQSVSYSIASFNAGAAGNYQLVVNTACAESRSGTTVLNAPPSVPGDANGDGNVNGADLSVLLGQFGQNVPPCSGADFNCDGSVNGADLSVLLGNFGS